MALSPKEDPEGTVNLPFKGPDGSPEKGFTIPGWNGMDVTIPESMVTPKIDTLNAALDADRLQPRRLLRGDQEDEKSKFGDLTRGIPYVGIAAAAGEAIKGLAGSYTATEIMKPFLAAAGTALIGMAGMYIAGMLKK